MLLDNRPCEIEYVFAIETEQLVSAPANEQSPGPPWREPENGSNYRGTKRWRLRESPFAGRLAHSGLPDLVARVLEARGVGSKREAEVFLGGREQPASDPFLIPGFETAVRRLIGAIANDEAVAVYGDFDVDGITATAILTETIADLGGQ